MSFDPREHIRFKASVMPAGVYTPMKSGILTMAHTIYQVSEKPTTITSMCDGRHGATGFTFHYVGMAADFRSKHLTTDEKEEVLTTARERLGNDWDLLLEAVDRTNEHYHLEFDRGRLLWPNHLTRLQTDFLNSMAGEWSG